MENKLIDKLKSLKFKSLDFYFYSNLIVENGCDPSYYLEFIVDSINKCYHVDIKDSIPMDKELLNKFGNVNYYFVDDLTIFRHCLGNNQILLDFYFLLDFESKFKVNISEHLFYQEVLKRSIINKLGIEFNSIRF